MGYLKLFYLLDFCYIHKQTIFPKISSMMITLLVTNILRNGSIFAVNGLHGNERDIAWYQHNGPSLSNIVRVGNLLGELFEVDCK